MKQDGVAWHSLKAGNLNKKTATLGLPEPSRRKTNTRQYRFAFSTLNTTVLDLANYFLIDQPGMSFGLNPASDSGAVAIVHVDSPGNPVYITPGTPKDIPEGFKRLYLERPTQPAVPARADLFYIFDTSDRVGGVQYGPLQPALANGGADNFEAPAEATVIVLPNAVTAPQALLAAKANRRIARIRNTSPGVETVYVTLDATSTNQDYNSASVIEALAPGQQVELAYTGAISVFASAITAKVRAYGLI